MNSILTIMIAVVSVFGSEILIDLSKQKLCLKDGKRIVLSTPISSGNRLHPTPTGKFRIIKKEVRHKSTLYPIHDDGSRGGASMNYMLRFNGSIAMHEGSFKYERGKPIPMSHGCIRIPKNKAKKLFYAVSVGTVVRVIGKADYDNAFNVALLNNDMILKEEYVDESNLNLTIDLRDIEELGDL